MKNPYAFLLEQAGISQREFASRSPFSRTVVLNAVAGLYPRLSDEQIIALGKVCVDRGLDAKSLLKENYGFETLQDAYQYWRVEERRKAGVALRNYTPYEGKGWLGPFQNMVIDTAGGEYAFANLLKVSPARVTEYARGRHPFMPGEIERALREVKWPHIELMKGLQSKWVASR